MRIREFFSNSQAEFVQKLLEKKLRLDKRGWKEFREVSIEYDKEENIAYATLGSTRVICSVEAEINAPRKISRPSSGSIQFVLELLSMAHPAASESTLDAEAEECLTMLETLYRDTSCIDFETLCIETNLYVFDLKCVLKVLDYDGGLYDCATIAVTTALMGFKRNDVTYDARTKKLIIYSASEKPMIPLTIIYKPATVTFGFVNNIIEPIIDPSESECARIEGYLIIGANKRGEICLMYQYGRLDITPDVIKNCSEFAISHAKSMIEKISTAVYGKSNKLMN